MVFVAVLVMGKLSMVVWWLVGSNASVGMAITLNIVLPALFMAVYIATAKYLGFADSNHEAFADSVYYLGFLFTLASLILSLIYLKEQGHFDFSRITYWFGTALTTTLLGMAYRVWTVTFSGSISGTLQRLDQEVIESVRAVRDRFEMLSQAMELQQLALRASVEKVTNEIDSTTGKLAATIEQFCNSTTTHIESIQRSGENVTGAVEAYSAVIIESTGKVKASISGSADDIDQASLSLKTRIAEAPLPPDLFAEALKEPLSTLRSLLNRQIKPLENWLSKANELGEEARRLADQAKSGFESVGTSAKQLTTRLTEIDTAVAGLSSQIDAVGKQLQPYSEHVARLEPILKITQQDHDASEVQEAEVVLDPVLVAHRDSAELCEPGEQALDLPAPPVAA